jgi:hypothetical protein
MLERLQKETSLVQEHTVRQSEAELAISQNEQETEVIRIELEGLRCSSEELYMRK